MTTPVNDPVIQVSVDKKFVTVEKLVGGQTKERDRFNPDIRRARVAAAKVFGVPDEWLLQSIDAARKAVEGGSTGPQQFTQPREESARGDLIVRSMSGKDESGTKYPLDPEKNLRELLPTVAQDQLVKWTDESQLCCLDVDYHDKAAPHESWLRARVTADLAPRPFAWHFSKSGGLHLFYVATPDFTADELAAAAALSFRRIDPTAGVELKTGLRGPGDKPVHYTPGNVQDTTALLAGWIDRTPADDLRRDEWLSSEGLEIGRRYDHTHCPIYPTPSHASTGDPVSPGETGVFCFNCEGQGRSIGCRRPGFAPYTALIGGETAGDLGEMIRTLCHWGHARYVLTRKYGLIESLAEKAYRAALKVYHHGKRSALLIPMVFDKDTAKLSRVNDEWYNLEESRPYSGDLYNLLSALPTLCSIDEKDKPKAKPASVVVFNQNHDLSDRGLPTVNTIFGFRMTGQHMTDPSEPAMVEVYRKALQVGGGRFLPKYVPKTKRNVGEAWGLLETIFPGLDRGLARLTMCAIASAQETRLGMPPIVFVTGPSGAAKTTTPKIGAAIMGGATADFSFRGDEARFYQQLYECNRNGGAVLMNELVKDTMRANRGKPITPTQPFDPLLTVTPDTFCNVLYKGPKQYGRLPAYIITEPKCPMTLRDETQIARRIRHWKVEGKKDWSPTFATAGLTDVFHLRALSPAVAEACNAIMSDVIDEFFCLPRPWDDIAEAIGCKKISESDEFEDLTPYLREFFKEVCKAPEIDNARLAKRYPNGYKRITRAGENVKPGEDDALTSVYTMFADGMGAEWLTSRRLGEKDWSAILKVGEIVHLDLTNDGVNVYARFRVGRPNKPTKVNDKIIDPSNWEV